MLAGVTEALTEFICTSAVRSAHMFVCVITTNNFRVTEALTEFICTGAVR